MDITPEIALKRLDPHPLRRSQAALVVIMFCLTQTAQAGDHTLHRGIAPVPAVFHDGFEALPCRFTPAWSPRSHFQAKAWDTTLAATLGHQRDAGPSAEDPVYLDMNRDDRLNVTGGRQIAFDINGDGIIDTVHEWNSQDGQLVYDANGNGIIDDGRELMNETGILGEQNLYARGWDKVRALFDANLDDIISGAELDQVLIWTDSNGDGVSDACELASANELNIISIDTTNGRFNVGALFADGFEPR